MPNAAASNPAPGKSPGAPDVNADRVGEELADEARIWRVYDQVAKQDDEERVQAWNRGFDNLALFATLFSAVTTAFLLEARNDMKPDYAELSFLVLNATNYGERFVHQQFIAPSAARTINALWSASLILSLLASLISVMGKEWMTMYTARPDCNLRQWAEIRTYRARCIEDWYMPQIIASTQPLLLHTSFVLFLVGLVFFISPTPFTHHLTLGLCVFSGFVYFVTALSAIIFASSPFKSPATQALRTALAGFFSFVQHRTKRNMVTILLRDVNMMLVGRADDYVVWPWPAADTYRVHTRRSPAAILSRVFNSTNAYVRSIPTSVRAVQWSHVRLPLTAIASSALRFPIRDLFVSSTWTDLATDPRPSLVAEALSWLSTVSQAPDVFRAIIFALGDLEIGPQVGLHTSHELRRRLRAEIDRTWLRVDFSTLARYVLADQNTPGEPALNYGQLVTRTYFWEDSAVRCEDALAAVIRVSPGFILAGDIARYSPDQVTQPRMPEFLLPHVRRARESSTDVLILLLNLYKKSAPTANAFELQNVEVHLYQSLPAAEREAYATEVAVKYGGTAGPVELLTFLCCHGGVNEMTKPAAIELLMHLLVGLPICEHRCLAYSFGSSDLWHATWQDKHWSPHSLWMLSWCLDNSRRHPFQPSSAHTQSDDHQFDLALARTSVMLLDPGHEIYGQEDKSIEFLFGYICQPPSRRSMNNDEKLDVIRLILERAALLRILGQPARFGYVDTTAKWGTMILATIISNLSHRLREEEATFFEGGWLFQLLVSADVKGENGDSLTWDLGEWLRSQAPDILKNCPSSVTAFQAVHEALVEIYPLCKANHELRAQWDRMGYPGRPGDIFSDPFLDVRAFFENAEAPPTRPGDIFDDPWFDLAEFLDGAEEGKYRWPEME